MILSTRFLISRLLLCFRGGSDGITTKPDGRHSFFIIKVNDNGDFLEDVFEFEGNTIADCIEAFENGNGICVNKFLYNEDTYIKDVNAFIEMPLFDGKSLLEIDREITVLYNS